MSSDYRRICLSHDPAIVIDDDEFSTLDAALAASVADTAHKHCDVMIGQYSYPLVRLFCLPGHGHSDTKDIDPSWLRLLWAAVYRGEAHEVTAAIKGLDRCWSVSRVQRLRYELDIDRLAEPAPASQLLCTPRSETAGEVHQHGCNRPHGHDQFSGAGTPTAHYCPICERNW